MQIHELNNFAGTPTSSDYLAIDNSTTTTKIGATGLGIQDQLTVAEANTGTSTASRIVTPKVVHDYVVQDTTHITSATKSSWASVTGNDGSLNDISSWLCPVSVPVTLTPATGTVNSVSAYQFGVFTIITFSVGKNTTTAAGSNIFSGALSINPLYRTSTAQYNGSNLCVIQVMDDGTFNCRALIGTWPASAVEGTLILYTG